MGRESPGAPDSSTHGPRTGGQIEYMTPNETRIAGQWKVTRRTIDADWTATLPEHDGWSNVRSTDSKARRRTQFLPTLREGESVCGYFRSPLGRAGLEST
jgi:hypothetical protein